MAVASTANRHQSGGQRRNRARAALGVAAAVATTAAVQAKWGASGDTSFSNPGSLLTLGQRAVVSAGLAASLGVLAPVPAYAEVDPSLKAYESQLSLRDLDFIKLQQQKLRPQMKQADIEKLEREELEAARAAEKLRVQNALFEENQFKEQVTLKERQDKVAIAKEEKEAKAAADRTLKEEEAQILKAEKAEIEIARKIEKEEKQAARDLEKKEKIEVGRDEELRKAAEDKSEASFYAASEKAENAIISANTKSEESLKIALVRSEEARIAAVERAELLERVVVEKAEAARNQASEKAEIAERDAVTDEEEVERSVVETVGEIEKEELLEENQGFIKAKAVLSTVGSAVAPVAIPGVLMIIYAFGASLVAGRPPPCEGGESDETRARMGRPPRPQTSVATLDPWEDTDGPKVPVGAGAMAGAAMLAVYSASGGAGAPGFAVAGGRAAKAATRHAVASRVTARASAKASSGATSSSVAALVAGAAASGAFALSGNRRGKVSRTFRSSRVKLQAGNLEISEENPLHVIIAGGGVGGLMLAKALSKEPTMKCTIFEQTNQFARFGGPIQIASNALSVIRDIDETLFNNLMDKFTFTGCRQNGLVDPLRNEWYCPFDAMKTSADHFELPYTGVVDRPDLQEILLNAIPEGMLQNSQKVSGYEVLPDYAGVKVQTKGGEDAVCDVLIGNDGIWSAIRAQMWDEDQKGPGSGCTYSGYIVFAGETIYKPDDYFDVGYKVYMGPKRYFVTSDVGRGRIQWYAFVAVGEGEQVPRGPREKKDYVKAAFQGWSQQVQDLLEATPSDTVEDRSLYDRPPSVGRSWADGPVALAGDACHPMMPNLGQGGCQAMEDAYMICEKLKGCKSRSEVPDALQDYYRSRVFRASAIQGLSRIASDLLLSTFTFPWKPSEGLSSPHGKGRGDFNYNAVAVSYLKYLLPSIFNIQFSFLYSYHPYKWTAAEVQSLVKKTMDRHRRDSEAAWAQREKAVADGTVGALEEEQKKPSFFTLAAQTK